ncbi:MAG: aldehyde ferredoxin oxidoreductase C-terminal domain-containing protein, partial [Candidatus Bathyarchaeia archaeon]
RKIWNLDNAIWTLQGRHRNIVQFMDYIYETPYPDKRPYTWDSVFPKLDGYVMPVRENGEWKFKDVSGRKIDRQKFEEWKTKYYKLEGWDPDTGWPTRKTLENLGLKHVANLLEAKGKLGKET